MKTRIGSFVFVALLLAFVVAEPSGQSVGSETEAIVSSERRALDRWGRGDPGGYLEIYQSEVRYFDPSVDRRIDGLDQLRSRLEALRGRIAVDRYEMLAPRVEVSGDMALLTYNLVSHGRDPDGQPTVRRWNSTVVYSRKGGPWKILHSHWSLTSQNSIPLMVSRP